MGRKGRNKVVAEEAAAEGVVAAGVAGVAALVESTAGEEVVVVAEADLVAQRIKIKINRNKKAPESAKFLLYSGTSRTVDWCITTWTTNQPTIISITRWNIPSSTP